MNFESEYKYFFKENGLRNVLYLEQPCLFTMTSSNGNIFRVTGLLWGESTGHWWIPITKASDAELWYFLQSAPEKCWAGYWRRHQAHYEVTVICSTIVISLIFPEQRSLPFVGLSVLLWYPREIELCFSICRNKQDNLESRERIHRSYICELRINTTINMASWEVEHGFCICESTTFENANQCRICEWKFFLFVFFKTTH